MKAAVIHEHGGLDVVRVEDIEEPRPGPGEVVLKVLCAGLNHLDVWVRKGGRVVLCGVTTGSKAESDLRALYWNQLTIMGSTMGSTEDFRQMLRAVTVNQLKPVVDKVYRLEQVRDALERMETGRQFGKIVLRIA